MVAIIEPRKEDRGLQFNRSLAQVGQVFGQIKGMQNESAKLEMAQEAHDMDMDVKKDALAHDQSTERYLGQIQQHTANNPDNPGGYKPDFTAPDFDARGWNSAQIMHADQAMKNEQFMQATMKTHKARATQQFSEINKHMGNAQAAVSGGAKDYGQAFKHIEAAYEMHNDGADLVLGKDGKSYSVQDATGHKMDVKFNSEEAMFADFQDKFAAFSGNEGQENYFKLYMKDQNERMQRNAGNITKSKYYANSKGDQVQVAYQEGSDGKGANRYLAWDKDNNFLGEISEESFTKGNFKDVSTRKGEAAIGASKAAADKSRTEKATDERKGWSTERKLAADLAETIPALKGDVGAAMRYVQEAKNAKNLLAAQKIATDQLMLDPGTPEYIAFMEAVTTKLPKKKAANLKPTGGLPAGTSGGDADKDQSERSAAHQEKAAADTPPKGYPNAKKAKDGEWYIKKDGKFFRVKK